MINKTDEQLRVDFISTSTELNKLNNKDNLSKEEIFVKQQIEVMLTSIENEMRRRMRNRNN